MFKHWPDWVNLILGLWLIVAPLTMQHSPTGAAALNAYVVGILIAGISIGALTAFQMWEEWTNLVLGFWLVAAPWALGFSPIASATWNQVTVGFLVIIFAIWELTLMGGYQERRA